MIETHTLMCTWSVVPVNWAAYPGTGELDSRRTYQTHAYESRFALYAALHLYIFNITRPSACDELDIVVGFSLDDLSLPPVRLDML